MSGDPPRTQQKREEHNLTTAMLDLFAGTGVGVAAHRLGILEYGVEIMPEAALSRTAPVDEWEYKYAENLGGTEYTYGDDDGKPFSTLEAARAARIEETDYVVRRRKAGPWEPIGGNDE